MHFHRIASLLIIQEFWKYFVIADYAATLTPLIDKPEDEHLELMAINGRDFRSNVTKDISGKPWHDDRKERYVIRCVRPTKCEKILTNTCFGAKIPYKFTSVELSEEGSQENSVKKLKQLEALQNVPKCWAVIQPFLCSVYIPKCTQSKGKEYVYLPSYEMCRITTEPCRILYDTDFFPKYLKCDEKVFPCKNCSNDVRDMKFTTVTSQCMSPLITTDSSINHYPDIEGCGLQCKDPMYTDDEHDTVHTLIFWGTILCFICNLFVIATFLIHDWKQAKHPAWNLFYISICFLCNWIGWILQFIPGHRENIVCRRDGTLRYSEPSAGENLACIIPFILIYYFLIAANVWFAIFTYAWYLQTKDRGSVRDRIDKESFYFHFIAWALPFILTVTIMVLSEVDGNSITGICFVGYRNRAIRSGLVLVPVAILTFGVSVFFSFKGGFNLNRIKRNTNSIEESKKLNSHILGMGIRTMLVVFFIVAFFVCESYELRNAEVWAKSLNDLIICKIKESYSGDTSKCKLQNRPSVTVLQLRLLCLFCVNLVIASWCWTWPALRTWKRFIHKKIGYEMSEEEQFTKPKQKHRIIADAYAKRNDDRISVSIENIHTDPAGLNFDMNNLNAAESDVMGDWMNYLCNTNNRRNAVTMPIDFNGPKMNFAPYTSSCADNNSEISVSVRHYRSVESRRDSNDSQVSQMQMSETKMTVESHSQKLHKMKAKKQRRLYERRTNRRASSTSVESQQITNQMMSYRYKHPNIPKTNAFGRNACTTVDINHIDQLLNRNNLQELENTSDDDDKSIEESTMMQIESESPSNNMLVPLSTYQRHIADSGERLNVSNDKHAVCEQVVKNLFKYRTGEEIEQLLNSYEKNGNGLNGPQNGRNSIRNSKSQRHSHNKAYPLSQKDKRFSSEITSDIDLATSISSSLNIDLIPPLAGTGTGTGTTSSFSDQSINRLKTQSQNSKRSCDVGIQANDYDIASHTTRDDMCDKSIRSEKLLQPNYHNNQDDDYNETHQLLPFRKRDAPTIVRKDTMASKHLSESERAEKLKKLLMPSH